MDEPKKTENEKDIMKQVEKEIECIAEEGIQMSNLDMLGKLVDIHKDLSNEDYWKMKEEVYNMRYDDYDREYGRRGVPGTGRGRYRGDYGRRGVKGTGRGRYRGDDKMDELRDHYDMYNEAYDEMDRGNYGAEGEMVKCVEGIMKNVYEIIEELSEADSPEVMRVIKRYTKKISEME